MTSSRQIFLRGEIIDLVLLEKDDATQLATWMNDPEVTRFLSRGDEPMTVAAEEGWVEKLYDRPHDLTFGIWHRSDEKLIGNAGLHRINPRDRYAGFGIVIGEKEYWGQGVGTDTLKTILHFAFNTRNLRSVRLSVLENNPRGRRCYEKCGFVLVGTYPAHMFKDGVWRDEILMICHNPNRD